MLKKVTLFLVACFLVLGCGFQALAQPSKEFDYKTWLYHPEKDKMTGSYEWWYMDAHLDNGYLATIVFSAPTIVSTKYVKYLMDMARGVPVPPYNPLDFAECKLTIFDEKNQVIFKTEQAIPPDQIQMPSGDNYVVRFGKNQLTFRKKGDLPEYTASLDLTDGKGKTAKGTFVFSNTVPAVAIGRAANLDATVKGKHLYHKWVVMAPTANVKADVTVTDADGKKTAIRQTGFGYHDKNWGNHPMVSTLKGWVWMRIADGDLTVVFAEVLNKVPSYPTYVPCVIAYKDKIVASTEAVEYIKTDIHKGRLAYPTVSTVKFLKDSGIKGEMKFYNLKPIYEKGVYIRTKGEYLLDIESKDAKFKKEGGMIFEFVDFAAPRQ